MMPPGDHFYEAEAIAHAARIGLEIGADVIKTNYSVSVDSFKQVVTSAPVPIIIAGGPKDANLSTLQMVQDAMVAGAAGVAIGRRVWQADDPWAVTADIHRILFGG